MKKPPTIFETFAKIQHLEEKTRQLQMEIAVLKAQIAKCEDRIRELDRKLKYLKYYHRHHFQHNGTHE